MKADDKSRIFISDTTLRDGEQAPGAAFSPAEKEELVRLLDEAGVDEMEVGVPAMGEAARREIRSLVALRPRCMLGSWCRALDSDLALAASCGTPGVHLSFPVSEILLASMGKDRKWVMDSLVRLVPQARDRFAHVSVGAQDAFRADPELLEEFTALASGLGAQRVCIADTVGTALPSRVGETVRKLLAPAGPALLAFHGHNDLGLAAANALAAAEAGAGWLSVTVNGMGERAGNAALEQVVAALLHVKDRSCPLEPRMIAEICAFVSRAAGRPIPPDRPLTGRDAFTHASGIHCAGMLRDPDTYQALCPESLGRDAGRLVVGRQSGSSVLAHVLAASGVALPPERAGRLLAAVRAEASARRDCLSSDDLLDLYRRTCV